MTTRIILDNAGRVATPKPLREELHLEPGDALERKSAGEQITLRPIRGTASLRKEQGVWVFYAGQPLTAPSTDEILRRIHDERDSANIGSKHR